MPDTDRGSQKNTGRNRAGGEKLKDTIENIAKNYEINPAVIFFLILKFNTEKKANNEDSPS
jgi:hypothetical protein